MAFSDAELVTSFKCCRPSFSDVNSIVPCAVSSLWVMSWPGLAILPPNGLSSSALTASSDPCLKS